VAISQGPTPGGVVAPERDASSESGRQEMTGGMGRVIPGARRSEKAEKKAGDPVPADRRRKEGRSIQLAHRGRLAPLGHEIRCNFRP